MKDKTLKELRELAKARGLRGYSKLTKEELTRVLEQKSEDTRTPAAAVAGRTRTAKTSRARAQTTPPEGPATAADTAAVAGLPSVPPAESLPAVEPAVMPPPSMPYASTEELVEGAKYALRPNGVRLARPVADLNEDIDRLPPLVEPLVCLLPQKPGILHAYWILPPGETASGDYKLRLCRNAAGALEVCEEVPVRAERGNWYFHIPERVAEGELWVQLGYYQDGTFRSARGRSIARLPSLYASARTDERWWVDERDFTQMYLRAGGFVTPARRFAWAASIGSPVAPPPSEQRLVWPGGVSSK